jgi:hypothetical protein
MAPDDWSKNFCKEHAISEEVWNERGYFRYEQGDPQKLARAAWPNNKSFAAKIANQCDGLGIPRYAPEDMGLPFVPAELRPDGQPAEECPGGVADGKVKTGTHWHFHDDELPEEWPCIPTTGNPLPRKWFHTGRTGPDVDIRQHIVEDHGGANVQVIHLLEERGKYVMCPGPGSKRLGVHPFSQGAFRSAPRVFMGIEGEIKNDAMVSALIAAEEAPAVFCVLSVTHWLAPELHLFAQENLLGKPVYIVCDADWTENWQVFRQAMLVREFLIRRGVDAHVAGPPLADYREDVAAGLKESERRKGVDDSLAAGRTLDDLDVVDRPVPEEIPLLVRDRYGGITSRIDKYGSRILENLSLHSGIYLGPDGKTSDFRRDGMVKLSMETIAKIVGVPQRTAQLTLQDLREAPNPPLRLAEGFSDEVDEGWYYHDRKLRKPPKRRKDGKPTKGTHQKLPEFKEIPIYVLHPDFCPGDLKTTRLEDGAHEHARMDADIDRMLRERVSSAGVDSQDYVLTTLDELRRLKADGTLDALFPQNNRQFRQFQNALIRRTYVALGGKVSTEELADLFGKGQRQIEYILSDLFGKTPRQMEYILSEGDENMSTAERLTNIEARQVEILAVVTETLAHVRGTFPEDEHVQDAVERFITAALSQEHSSA